MIRAKFKCTSVEQFENGAEKVNLMPVYNEANKDWSKFTPAGGLWMSITKEGASGQFKPGVEYFFDFTVADS